MAKSKVSKKMRNIQRRDIARRERLKVFWETVARAWIEKQRAK